MICYEIDWRSAVALANLLLICFNTISKTFGKFWHHKISTKKTYVEKNYDKAESASVNVGDLHRKYTA